MKDKTDILGKYKQTGEPFPKMEQKPELVKSDKPYMAVTQPKTGDSKGQFKIYDKDGGYDFMSYSHIIGGSFKKGIITLHTPLQIFTITGKNLTLVATLISDKKAGAIYEFNPNTQKRPQDENTPVIETIESE